MCGVCVGCGVWCVCVGCAEEAAAEEEEPGIQNQKQEPHTKMWGTKHMGSAFVFTYNPPISVIPSRLFQKTKIWQVASGSFKRVYLPEIFSNVSKKKLLFQETSSF